MKRLLLVLSTFVPHTVRAAPGGDDIFSLQELIFNFFTKLSIFFWVAAVAFFMLGVIKFIKNADDSAEREKGKLFMIWGIIAFAVLASLWGLVEIFADTIGVTTGGMPDFGDKDGNKV